jgi:hypothetical protein
MSKLLQALGALFFIAGLVLAVMTFAAPGEMQVRGLTPEAAAVLLVGGLLAMGLGSLLDAVLNQVIAEPAPMLDERLRPSAPSPAVKPPAWTKPLEPEPLKTAAAAAPAAAAGAASATSAKLDASKMSPGVAETITALEQAKSDIATALGIDPVGKEKEREKEKPALAVVPPLAAPAAAPTPLPTDSDEASDDPDLYVVEEKVIKGRPARILSDGTVEAETDEGWMRFENLEHLDEYLEAMAP